MDDALVKACLFECFDKGEALAGLVIAPDQHGGAIMQVQQPADLGLAQPWSMKNKAHEDLRMMPGLDVLARDLDVGLGSVEGAVDHPIHDSIAIFFFLLALYVRLPLIVHSHYERQSTSDPQPREEGLASRHHCSEASMHRYKASGQLGPVKLSTLACTVVMRVTCRAHSFSEASDLSRLESSKQLPIDFGSGAVLLP